MIKKREIVYFAAAAIVMGFLFGFRDIMANNLLPWLSLSGLALITIFVNILTTEATAAHFGCDADYSLWAIRRRGKIILPWFLAPVKFILKKMKIVPLWFILPLGFIFLTWGFVKWLAIIVFNTTTATRLGKEYVELTEWELALIAFAGPFMNLLLAIVSQFAGWTTLANMSLWFAFFNLLPIGELNGAKIFYGSRLLWVFVFVFTIAILILLKIAHMVTTLIAAGVLGLIAVIFLYLVHEKKV